jgi:hypothetical protein
MAWLKWIVGAMVVFVAFMLDMVAALLSPPRKRR